MRSPRLFFLACTALVAWLGLAPATRAQLAGVAAPGALPMRTYTTGTHPGVASNWAVAFGPDARVYVGNGEGLYTVRGSYISPLYTLANRGVVRSVAHGPDGLVYVGSSNELGYFVPAADGTLRYVSLLPELPEAQRTFQDVWLVQVHGASVYFYAYRQIMRWTPSTGTMDVWRFNGVVNMVRGGAEPVVQRLADGALLHLVDGHWRAFLHAPEVLASEQVRLITPHPSGDSLVVTGRGLYRLRRGRLVRQPSLLDGDERRRVYDAVALPGGYLALGTLYEGVLFVTPEGALVRQFSKQEGAPDNAVLALGYDGQGHLWVCLERGLARLDVGSGVTFIGGREGLTGDASAMAAYEGALYVGGMEQLARVAEAPHAPLEVLPVPGDEVLDLLPTPHGLLVGLSGGLRVYRDGRLEEIPGFTLDGDYPAALLHSSADPTRVYVGYRRGLAVLRLDRGRWVFSDTVAAVTAHVTSLAEEADGTLWLGTPHEDLWRVRFGGAQPDVTSFGPQQGLPRYTVAPLRLDTGLVIYTSRGFYRLQGERVVRDSSALAALFGYGTPNVADARVTEQGDVLMVVDAQTGLARRTETGYRWQPLSDRMLTRSASLAAWMFDGDVWTARTHVLTRTPLETPALPPFATKIEAIRMARADSLVYGGHGALPPLKLSGHHGIAFTVSTPRYDGAQFRFWLEGAEEGWSAWGDHRERRYSALRGGRYRFRAQARDRFGNVSEEAVYAFAVGMPWYASRLMVSLYVVLALLLVLGCTVAAARWQEKRSEAARRLLRAKVRVHTREAEAQKRMLRYLNKTLQESNAQLEELSEQKSRLLSIAAHDLKTPLASIYSLADVLLEERGQEPPNYEFVELIRASARRMSTLIDEVLGAEARATGQLQINPVASDLYELAGRAVQQCQSLAERKGQSLRLHRVPPGAGFGVQADEARIVEAMVNLVGNAIKYSPPGAPVEVHVAHTDEGLRFEVRDEGPGLREEDRAGLFQPFQRLSAQPTGGESSSGMGLYIVRQYVEMHGGRVGVETVQGAGSIFWFSLPRQEQPLADAATPADAGSGSRA